MRVPLSWLAEYVDVPAGTSAEQVADAFVRVGLEVESVTRLGEGLSGPLAVGRVLEVEELTEFRKPIRYVKVDVADANGTGEPQGVICGATNFAAGDLVVVVMPGATLPGGFAISSRKTYGRVSNGMICSARELGLGEDHAGIVVLAPGTAEVGEPAVGVLGLDDVVYELAITPDRGYCFSVRGIARELAHALNVPFHDPGAAVEPPARTEEPPYPVTVVDTHGCDRFVGRVVRGVDPSAPTPWWMVRRLLLAGVRSISLAVDLTNYLMLELGQPMHAFDLDRLTGSMTVRRATAGERLRTLDGVDRALDQEDLIITDGTGPISLAAVMGGETTEVQPETTDLLLEAAHWNPVTVARAARRHRLSSEASKRFERGVDPEMAPVACERAVQLLVELSGGKADPRVLDVDHHRPPAPVHLDGTLPGRTAGLDIAPAEAVDRLREVGCTVATETSPHPGSALVVHPPTWRPDLTDPADLVEEVVRLHGYDEIPSVLPHAPAGPGLTADQRRRHAVATALGWAGYVEVLSYPFVDPGVYDAFGLPADDPRRRAVRLANPLADTEPEMRTSLLPGLLRALTRNVGRGARDVALYEMGLVTLPEPDMPDAPKPSVERRPSDQEIKAVYAAVPHQPRYVAVVLAGDRDLPGWWGPGRPAGWQDAVAAARLVGDAAGMPLRVRRGERPPWHPGRCAEVLVDTPSGERLVGHAGELHPRVVAELELPPRTCAVELNLDALPFGEAVPAPAVSTFPPALLDVALVVDEAVPADVVEGALRSGAGELLEAARLFDVYTGPQVGEGRKSLAYALAFRAGDRTLTVEEAVGARDAAVAEAGKRVGAEIRT